MSDAENRLDNETDAPKQDPTEVFRQALLNQGRDTARLSHDLNNRAFAVMGRIELMRDAVTQGDMAKIQRFMEAIAKEMAQLGEKVHELNDMAHRYDLLIDDEAATKHP